MHRNEPSNTVQCVERALRILIHLGESGSERSVSCIARDLGLNISTTHRLLCSLRALGFVQQNPSTSRYSLGLRHVQLGQSVLEHLDYRQEAQPILRYLRHITGETANLVIRDKYDVVYVQQAATKTPLGIFSRIGHRAPLHATSVGKVLLCELPKDKVRDILSVSGMPAITERTICNIETFFEELKRVRQVGYATDDEECERGARCVAAAVRSHTGEITAALGVSGPASRFGRKDFAKFGSICLKMAAKVSEKLGYVSPRGA